MKKTAIGIAALLLVVGLAAHFLFSNLDSIVEAAVEKYGSEATGTKVRLSSVKIKLADGAGTLEDLDVGNPSGFSSKQAVELGAIDVTIDTASVTGNGPVIIKTVTITGPKISYEVGSDNSTNLDAIKRHASASQSDDGAAAKPARKFIINDLYIKGGQISISHPLLQGKGLSASLPNIHLHDVGKSSGGATPGEIASKVASSIESAATKVSVPDLQKQLGSLKGLAGSGVGKVGDTAGKVGGTVKGLFGR